MEFFDKVKKVATDVAAVSSKKSKKVYAITKLKLEVAEKQKAVKDLYKEIGFDAYKAYKANSDIVEYISEKLAKIDALEDEMAYLRKDIDDIKNTDEVGIDEIFESDEIAQDAQVIEDDFDETETEPIDPIE